MQKVSLGVGRAGSPRSAGPGEGNVNIILKVKGQQAFSLKGHTVNNSDLTDHKLSVTTTQQLSSAVVAEAVFE